MKKVFLFFVLVCCTSLSVMAQSIYIIQASAGAGGTMARSGIVAVEKGASQQFIITPNTGYRIAGIRADGAEVGWTTLYTPYYGTAGSYTFTNVQAGHTLSAFFAPATQYTIHALASPNGRITPAGDTKVNKGINSPQYTITASNGYAIEQVLVDNVAAGPFSASTTFNYTFYGVTSDHVIKANFISKDSSKYVLKATATAGGSVTPNLIKAKYGEAATFTFVPAAGFVIAGLKDNTTSYGQLQSNKEFKYTVSNIRENHLIQGLFDSATHTVTASGNTGGTVVPARSTVAYAGTAPAITVTANPGYVIEKVLMDGYAVSLSASQKTGYSTTISYVYTPHTLTAFFVPEQSSYNLRAGAAAGGTVTPPGTSKVVFGNTQNYTIKANAGYAIKNVTVDGKLISTYFDLKLDTYNYSFADVRGDHTIEASFASLGTRSNIISLPGFHGSISPLGISRVKYSDSLGFDIKAAPGYRVQDVLVDDRSQFSYATTPQTDYHYRFSGVVSDHLIVPWFSPLHAATFRISTSTTPEVGNIYGPALVDSGALQLYRIIPRPDFKIALNRLLIDGYPEDPAETYLFTNITTDHELQADFSGKTDCDFLRQYQVPRSTALPSFAKSFQHVYVLPHGNDLGTASIGWDDAGKRLQKFLLTPANGNEAIDLSNSTQNFARSGASITLTKTNLSPATVIYLNSIDNTYYANLAGNDFVLVAKSGLYALYCTDAEAGPAGCVYNGLQDGSGTLSHSESSQVSKETALPSRMLGVYPNPFSRSATIRYMTARRAPVSIYISDLSGKKVAVLSNGQIEEAGTHQVVINGALLLPGTYMCTIQTGNLRETKQLVHVRE